MREVRVVIVEDEVIVAEDLRRTLEASGYEVSGHAMEQREAVEMACHLRPDVVLMDVCLADGSDGLAAARTIQRAIDTSIIFVSAYCSESVVSHAVRSGAFGYVVKPFQPRQITSSIEIALHRGMEARLLQGRAQHPPITSASDSAPGGGHDSGWPSSDTSFGLMLQRLQTLLADEGPGTGHFQRRAATGSSPLRVTRRERDVIRGLVCHRRLSTVALMLGISVHTARNHLKSAFRKLNVHSQEGLFRLLLEG